jgi:hypothetical protein
VAYGLVTGDRDEWDDMLYLDQIRLGVLAASLLSGTVGALVLTAA